jgi:hypothetical protein
VSRVSDGTIPRREDVDLTEYAVEQYRARSRPALDHAGARAELARLAPNREVFSAAPNWVRSAGTKPLYLVIGDTLALPLAAQDGRWMTTTCRVKTTLSERRREERTREKARRASAKRAHRRARR